MGIKVSKACGARFESASVLAMGMHESMYHRLTSFAYSEQLVDVPGDNSTGESAPTPLDNAAEGLYCISVAVLEVPGDI